MDEKVLEVPTDAEFQKWLKKQESPEEKRLKLIIKCVAAIVLISLILSLSTPLMNYFFKASKTEYENKYRVLIPQKWDYILNKGHDIVISFKNTGLESASVTTLTLQNQESVCTTNITVPTIVDTSAEWKIHVLGCIKDVEEPQDLIVKITGTTTRRSLEAGSAEMFRDRMKWLGADDYTTEKAVAEKMSKATSRQNAGQSIDFTSTGVIKITVI